uniref:DEAD-box ATP-dependent RNA helicase 52B-like n=1 Tax=Erigeron canadensis TaxID=72917 RepID=UPI001CB92CB9|nr:DEAD-box ATP-dependent RNA helicase 52B-like [Erigeron canadensis]
MRLSYADVVAKPPRPRPTSIESHRRFITNTSYVQNLEQCDTPININANEETEFPDKIKDGGLDLSVVVTGPDVPSPIVNFTDVDFSPTIIKNIRKAYVCPTPIQRHAIPVIMAGHDIMACAQTGSGKTAAFCFPIISGVLKEFRRVPERLEKVACPLALILSPTRELCCQIFEVSKNFCNQTGVKVAAAYGGEPKSLQLKSFESGVDILVATPGRLIDFCELSKVSLKMIKYMVIDEADLMLHMGFEPQIRKIVEHTEIPRVGRRQTMLFCATLPYKVQTLASAFLSDHVFISVGRGGSSTHLIIQELMLVEDNEKPQRLKELLDYPIANGNLGKTALVLIFVATKKGAYSLECWLNCNGFSAVSLHGDKCQMERERALASFKMGLTPILVATDLASRGLDVAGIAQVVNYDLPRDIDTYVQRIGRTGRAGKGGRATSFFTSKNLCLAKALSALLKECHQDAPNWLYKYAERYMCLNDHHLDFNKSLKIVMRYLVTLRN